MTLRQHDWPTGHHSTVTMILSEIPQEGTQLKFIQINTPQEKQVNEDTWERLFWRRLRGFPIVEPLQMITVFATNTLEETICNLTDPNYMSKIFKSPCTIVSQPGIIGPIELRSIHDYLGGPYCLMNNKVQGSIVKIDIKEIVLKLTFEEFPQNYYSSVTITLEKLPGHGI